MQNETVFDYTYSAPDNQEVLDIRSRYLPRQETGLEELRRLDRQVRASGVAEGLALGIGGSLLFGLGLCFFLQVLGTAAWPGVLPAALGVLDMSLAYPVCQKRQQKSRQKFTPRILELTDQLIGEQNTRKKEEI